MLDGLRSVGKAITHHKTLVVLSALLAASVFSRTISEFGSFLWFPPAWRSASSFVLVFVAATSYGVFRSIIESRRRSLEESMKPRESSQAMRKHCARRAMVWLGLFVAVFLSYVLLWHRCVLPFDRDDESDTAVAPVAATDAKGSGDGHAVAKDTEPYLVYLPVSMPEDLENYFKAKGGIGTALATNLPEIEFRLAEEHRLRMGITTGVFFVIYFAMVLAMTGAFVYSFDTIETLGHMTVG